MERIRLVFDPCLLARGGPDEKLPKKEE